MSLGDELRKLEKSNPAVAQAAASYDAMRERAVNTFPYHYRDNDGPVCTWSGSARLGDDACPNGCAGSRSHYANDGHPQCEDGG